MRAPIAVAFWLALALLVGVTAVSYRSIDSAEDILQSLARARAVKAGVEDVASAYARATSARRSYTVAGDRAALDGIPALDAALDQAVKNLERAVQDDPVQRDRVDRLVPLMRERERKLDAEIASRRAGAGALETADDLAIANRIRATREQMEEEENRRLVEHEARTRRTLDWTRVAELAGTIVSFAILVVSFLQLRRARALAEAANVATTRRNVTLERRDAEQTAHLQRSREQLAASEDQLRALALRIETVREQERAELAREIHDVLGQELTGLKMDVAWVLRRIAQPGAQDPSPPAARLEAVLTAIDTTIGTIQRISTGLRPGVLDDLGLVAACKWQAREFEARSGIAVDLTVPGEDLHVGNARSTALFRVLQELLTNVARHAQARRVQVALSTEADRVVLDVRDDGRGIAEPLSSALSSLGLVGVRERVRPFGGDLEIGRAPAGGTRARVWIEVGSPGEAA